MSGTYETKSWQRGTGGAALRGRVRVASPPRLGMLESRPTPAGQGSAADSQVSSICRLSLARARNWLRGLDSNQDNQLQRLACYQLHYPGLVPESVADIFSICSGAAAALRRLPLRSQFASLLKPHRAERCPSGLRSTLGKRVLGKLNRGFESHPLRHSVWAYLIRRENRAKSALLEALCALQFANLPEPLGTTPRSTRVRVDAGSLTCLWSQPKMAAL